MTSRLGTGISKSFFTVRGMGLGYIRRDVKGLGYNRMDAQGLGAMGRMLGASELTGRSQNIPEKFQEALHRQAILCYTVKKTSNFPVRSRDVTYQTLPGLE